MRPYAPDSPEAMGRLLALAALADGQVSAVELAVLEGAGLELGGLSGADMRRVLHGLCEDLLLDERPATQGMVRLEAATLHRLFDDIQSPALRLQALRLGIRVARADRRLHEAESQLLLDAMSHWGMLEAEGAGRAPN